MNRVVPADIGLLVLRLGYASLLIGFHGWTRLQRAVDFAFFGQPWTFVSVVERLGFPFPPAFAVLSVLAESIGPVFLAAGLFTRTASCIVAVNMTVAVANEWRGGDPIELPALYLLGAVAVMIAGPGRLSIDRRRG
jgi:putative oxidoreductase